MKVVAYNHANDVTIQWECGQLQTVSSGNFKSGNIRYLNDKPCLRAGYIGYGKYVQGRPKEGEIKIPKTMENPWRRMINRIYSEDCLKQDKNINYRDTNIQEGWLNLQNFCEWCFKQEGWDSLDDKGNRFQLDKDILDPDNKEYCREVCVFVPHQLNVFFSKKIVGKFGRGVKEVSKDGKVSGYTANVSELGEEKYLGFYQTPEEAVEVYYKEKVKVAKRLAEIWKGRVDDRVIDRLNNFKIEDIFSKQATDPF